MIISVILLIVGFVILIKGADIFVDGASSVAANFKVSKMLIGLTIVAFGTSAPEFAVSIKSLLSHNGDMVLGNVIGSNILNILLILGCSAVVHTLNVKNATVKKELPITMLITALFAVLLTDGLYDKAPNMFTRGDGIVLMLFFLVYLYYLFTMMRNKTTEEEEDSEIMPMSKAAIYTVLGLVGIVLGSNFVVDSASEIARFFGVSQRMISLTIIALGTSLPELVTSVAATRKGEYDIAIGNVVGSNIFNIGLVVALPVALFGGIGRIAFSYIDLAVMLLASILLFVFSFRNYKLNKTHGIIFLAIFAIYYSYVIFS